VRRVLSIPTAVLWAASTLIPGAGLASGEPPAGVEVEAFADRTRVRIGDAITYRVTVRYDSTLAVAAAIPKDALAGFDVRDHAAEDAGGPPGQRGMTERFVLASYTPGHQRIGPRPYLVRSPDGTLDTLWTAEIPVDVVSTLPAEAEDIRDIKDPAEIRARLPGRWLILAGGAALAAAALAWWVLGRRRRPREMEVPPPRPAHEVAYEAFEELRCLDLPGSGRMKAYYIALSEILRRYLSARFGIPAMDRTTAELLQSLRQSECLMNTVAGVRTVLQTADRAKFARWQGTLEEADASIRKSLAAVDETRVETDGRTEPEVAASGGGGA